MEFTRDLLTDEEFIRFRDSIARALMAVPRIESPTIERFAAIHLDPDYKEVAAAWVTPP